ncbi:MAG: hypothetical protein AAF830_07695, partial [Pseudomonadota bacterium]
MATAVLNGTSPEADLTSNNTTADAISSPKAPQDFNVLSVAEHVVELLNTNDIEEARVWYFRGLARGAVENQLADNYAFSGFTRTVSAHPDAETLINVEISKLEALVRG